MTGFCRPALAVLILTALALVACGGGKDPHPTPLPPDKAYETGPCPFEVKTPVKPECGYLSVPEDREHPDSGTIAIAVAVFKARTQPAKADPIVYLDGGPGGHTLEVSEFLFDDLISPFLDTRDFILYDQRGIGYSKPALDCPEIDEFIKKAISEAMTRDQYVVEYLAAVTNCHDDLNFRGVNPALASSKESAADLADLRVALGYQSWNLYGISYGTRLALTVMRDHPEGVRSVMLDSTYPPQMDLPSAGPGDFHRALSQMFDDCAADAACNSAFPDLGNVFYQTVADLNENPRFAGGFDEDGVTLVYLSGDLLLELMFQALYSTDLIPRLPEVIYSIHNEDDGPLTDLLKRFLDAHGAFSLGVYLSVECGEELSFSSKDAVQQEISKYPEISGAFRSAGLSLFDQCAAWAVPNAPAIENEPVVSDIPTLVMAGSYDPITPPDWGRDVAAHLSHSAFFQLPGVGHGVIPSSTCAQSIATTFLDAPSVGPASDCLATLTPPDFTGD
jgi:pimeloyl-ACP methyl ester carboxylesterase